MGAEPSTHHSGTWGYSRLSPSWGCCRSRW